MSVLDLDAIEARAKDAAVHVADADRCVSLHIAPAAYTLHRSLRAVSADAAALVAEVRRLRLALEEAQRR